MKRWLNSPWFVAVLCGVATYFVVQSIFDLTGPARPVARPAMTDEIYDPHEASPELIEALGSIDEALARLNVPANPRDPFDSAPTATTAVATLAAPETVETLRLSAIWEQGSSLLLVINNRVRTVGEHIGPVLIESATMDGVWLSYEIGREYLPFGGVVSLVTSSGTSGVNKSNDDEI